MTKEFVAVYGTLKRDQHNHNRYLAPGGYAESNFIGSGKTSNKYPLIVEGLPFLHNDPGKGYNVDVEVYEVGKRSMNALDRLEGHPTFYYREKIDVDLESGEKVKAWVYFINSRRKCDYAHAVESFTGSR